jgi:23S rRNA pseudouridine2605 synthase
MALERIQKILARAGISSRREAERLIVEGRVMVNGKVVDALGFKADASRDYIKVDGKRIARPEPPVTVLLNKPRNMLSTVKDPLGRPTVMDLVKKVRARVYPVGRLDFDGEGLLLLTNEGDLAYRLSHPRFAIPRTYEVKVEGIPAEKELKRLKSGVSLEDGRASAVSVRVLGRGEKNCRMRVVVTEGRNHLVKRMLEAVGHPVLKLKRVQFGPLHLGDLSPGQFRYLTPEEIEELRNFKQKVRKDEFGTQIKSKQSSEG